MKYCGRSDQIGDKIKNGEGFGLSAHQARQSDYRPEIDGLRALAVVSVIINHTNRELLPSGYLGVDIFFVISGFVITSSLAARNSENFFDFIVRFYVRRIKRLIPALVFFVLVVGLLICFFDSTPKQSLRTGISSLFGVSNLYLLKKSTDYFADTTYLNIFAHTWSLGVEEQFYLLFPVLFWFSGFASRTENGLRQLLLFTITCSVASLIAFVIVYQFNQPMAYFLMPTRFWELGAGCLLFLVLKHFDKPFWLLEKIPSSVIVVALITTLFLPLELAVPATIAVVLLTVATIATVREATALFYILTHRYIVFIGVISYSLYLWHWGVLSLAHWSIGIHWWNIPLLFAVMFAMAAISFRFVEQPLRFAQWSSNRHLSITYGISVLIISGAVLFALMFQPMHGRLYLGRLLGVGVPYHLQVTWWKDRRTGKYLERCHVEKSFSNELMKECFAATRGGNGVVYLLGDSFARNYLMAIKNAFPGKSTVYLTMGYGCAFLPKNMSTRYSKVKCSNYVSDTSKYIQRNANEGDVVVIGQRLNNKHERQSPAYVDFIKSFASQVSMRGTKVILLDSTFPPKLSPHECIPLPWRPIRIGAGCHVDPDIVSNAFIFFDQLAYAAEREVSNLFYVPLRMGLCHGDVCGQITAKGTPIWHDKGGHITDKAAAELAPILRKKLHANGFFTNAPTNQ